MLVDYPTVAQMDCTFVDGFEMARHTDSLLLGCVVEGPPIMYAAY